MTYFVYLIGNYKKLKLTTYVGYTRNLKKRIDLHNNSKGAKFTRGRKWKILYSESLDSKSDAMKREYQLKRNSKLRSQLRSKIK